MNARQDAGISRQNVFFLCAVHTLRRGILPHIDSPPTRGKIHLRSPLIPALSFERWSVGVWIRVRYTGL